MSSLLLPLVLGGDVHDVLAHHVGVVAGVAAEDLGGYGELSFDIS